MRSAFIDNIKGMACLLIVFHHLAFYGPMSDVAHQVIPKTIEFFFEYGRMAVAVFLCLGGFLTGIKISKPNYFVKNNAFATIGRKYIRLLIPYLAAIVLAILCSWIAKQWMQHDSISENPEVLQLISHLFFLQNIVGYESLSAGLWYVAIDFQLFVVSVLIVFLVEKFSPAGWSHTMTRSISLIIFGLLIISSVLFFNRHDVFDVWFMYYFASYGFGLLAAFWIQKPGHYALIAVIGACLALGLYEEFRVRLLISLLTALLLYLSHQSTWGQSTLWHNHLGLLGKISYSVFLVHFPISLLISSLWVQLFPQDPWMNVVGMITSAVTSILVAIPFYQFIEKN